LRRRCPRAAAQIRDQPLKTAPQTSIMTPVQNREAPLSEVEPIAFRPRVAVATAGKSLSPQSSAAILTTFDRRELNQILGLYGRKVAAGEWRDYAIDFGRDKAVFSVFRRSSEMPLYRIEKQPRLARRQGAYGIVSATGLILKRGHDLARVLAVLEARLRLASY